MGFYKTPSALALVATFIFSTNISAQDNLADGEQNRPNSPDFACASQTYKPDLTINSIVLTTSDENSPIIKVMKLSYIFESLHDLFLTSLPNSPLFNSLKTSINPGLKQQIRNDFERNTSIDLNNEITPQQCPEILKHLYGSLNLPPPKYQQHYTQKSICNACQKTAK